MNSNVLATDASAANSHDRKPSPPTISRPRLFKWTIIILVIISMIGEPQLEDWVRAMISHYKQPSFITTVHVFFKSITLLYNMTLGGYAAWAFLTYTRIRGSQHDSTGRSARQQLDAPQDTKDAAS
jgi:hypothetical protein